MRAGIYIRVSGDEQAKRGYSLPDQVEACTKHARELGADDVAIYDDAATPGTLLEERSGLMAMFADAKAHRLDVVVCLRVDRWSRDNRLRGYAEWVLEQAGVPLVYLEMPAGIEGKSKEAELVRGVLGAAAQFEHGVIRERTMRGRTAKARAGKLPWGGRAPYGYRFNQDRSNLVIEPEEAEVVRRIYRAILAGDGLNGIAHGLMRAGVSTARGGTRWHRHVVRQIARNPIYGGEYQANRRDWSGTRLNRFRGPGDKVWARLRPPEEWIAVPVPAIVAREDWQRAQANMDTMAAAWHRPASAYLLTGLVRCGICGLAMSGRRAKNWGRGRSEYTCRKSTAGARHPGCGRRVPADEIEVAVWDRVVHWLHDPGMLAAELEEASPNRERLERESSRAKTALADLRQKVANLVSLVERGAVLPEDIAASLERLRQRQTALEVHCTDLQDQVWAMGGARGRRSSLEEAARVLGDLGALAFEERKALVRQLVQRVAVGQETVLIEARAGAGGAAAPVAAAAQPSPPQSSGPALATAASPRPAQARGGSSS